MPDEWTTKTIRPMTGGMVTAIDGKFLADDQFQLIQNYMLKDGLWQKRLGLEPLYLSNPLVALRLYFSNLQNGPFVDEEAITGSVSGAVGQVTAVTATYLTIATVVVGDFIPGETITGDAEGAPFATATVDQVQVPLIGTIIGLWRFYKPNGDKYSICIDIDTGTYDARLLMKKNDTIVEPTLPIPPVGWKILDANYCDYVVGGKPSYFFATPFGNKLILTDGQFDVRFFEEQDGTDIIKGRIGAFRPRRQSSVNEAIWEGNPIVDGGFVQYCTRYVYEDAGGKRSYSNPSPRSPIYAMDWMGKAVNGFGLRAGENDDNAINVGPTRIRVTDLPDCKEHMASATDLAEVKRIIRRDVFRRSKRFADNPFGPWIKVGDSQIKDGRGGGSFSDQDKTPPSDPLDTNNYPPPKAKYPLLHKNHLLLYNYIEDEVIAPPDQADVDYPYYESFGLLKRATIVIKNNTNTGYTDAIVRIRLQWGTPSLADYIDFDDSDGDANHNFAFADDDGFTPLSWYRESYSAANNFAVFVVRVPEILENSSALIYVYYNHATHLTDDNSDDEAVYHRKYSSSKMKHLMNFDYDFPMPREDFFIMVDRITCNGNRLHGGAITDAQKVPHSNNVALTLPDEGCILFNADDGVIFLESAQRDVLDEPEGTIEFFVRTPNPGDVDGYLLTSFHGGRIFILYGAAANQVDIYVAHDADDEVPIPLGITFGDNTWYYICVSWGGATAHAYVRPIDGNNNEVIATDADLQTVHPTGGTALTLGNRITGSYQGHYDEFAFYKHCRTMEETEAAFNRRNLDAYFHDVLNARAAPGWGADGFADDATCQIEVFDITNVGEAGDQKPSGLAISDGDNPHIFSYKNRRSVGESAGEGTGQIELNGDVYLHKNNGIYRLRTDGELSQWMSDDAPVDEARGIGCVAPMTLRRGNVHGRECAIFLSNDGLYAHFGGKEFLELSAPISDVIRDLNGEEKASCVGMYIGRHWEGENMYILGIAETERAILGSGTLDQHSPTYYVPDKCYVFHLDGNPVKVSNLTAKQATGFALGYPCVWETGRDKDNGEVLFGNNNLPYIYVWGKRGTPVGEANDNTKYVDKWIATNENIPVSMRVRKFWHESALFRGLKPFYRAQHLDGATMKWYNNKLKATARTYDELAFATAATDDPVTHAAIASILSGGHDGGKMYLLPSIARGEWIDVLFDDQEAAYADGVVIWQGFAYEFANLMKP